MKKKISRLLLKLAKWLYPVILDENAPSARPMGLCIHITKKDVRDFRKKHPEIKSHREGLRILIDEAKWRLAGTIGRGMMEKGVINYNVKKTLYVADVSGVAFLYGGEESTAKANGEA